MSVLFKFKQWLLLDEAAEYLSRELWEDVTKADLLRLALDGHLSLSVYFPNHAYGRPGKVIPLVDAVRKEIRLPDIMNIGSTPIVLQGTLISESDGVIELADVTRVARVSGICDIPAWAARYGAASLDIEEEFLSLIDGPNLELMSLSGVFVTDKEGTLYQLLDRFDPDSPAEAKLTKDPWDNIDNFFPAASFPSGSMFVIRTSELQRLKGELTTERQGSLNDEASPGNEIAPVNEPPAYSTRLLAIQAGAIERFWVRYDPAEQDTAPDGEEIISWLIANGCSKREAEAIDLIIRHDRRKKGGRMGG